MKALLVAAYYFPPYADVSGIRVTKFCKYLPGHGWQPTVLTVDPRYYGARVVKPVPPEVHHMNIQRIPFLPLPGATLLVKLLFPLWICATAWWQRRRLAAVYLVGSPFHPFVATAVITPLLGLPSLLDFRDSWSINPMFSRFRHRWQRVLVRGLRGLIEGIGIRHASAVAFATPGLQADYEALLPRYRGKFHTIDNGFDPADFESLVPERPCPGPTLILTGKFYFYTPEVVEGLMRVLPDFPHLYFLYVGGEAALIRRLAEAAGASAQVRVLEFQPAERMLRLIKGADYGLVTHAVRYAVGTKIFDYLALGKPVLCFVPTGSAMAASFAHIPGVVFCHPPFGEAEIRAGLRRLLARSATVDPGAVAHFSRPVATAALARLLTRIGGQS